MYPNIEELFNVLIQSDDHETFLCAMTRDSDKEFSRAASIEGAKSIDIESANSANCIDHEKAGFIYGFRTAVKLMAEVL